MLSVEFTRDLWKNPKCRKVVLYLLMVGRLGWHLPRPPPPGSQLCAYLDSPQVVARKRFIFMSKVNRDIPRDIRILFHLTDR